MLYKTSLLLLLIIAKKNPKNQNKKTEHFWKCTLFLRICPTTSTSEASVNIFSLLSFHCLFLLEYVFIYSVSLMKQGNYNFLGCSGNPSFKQKISTKVIWKKITSSLKEYFTEMPFKFQPRKFFSKNCQAKRAFVYKN